MIVVIIIILLVTYCLKLQINYNYEKTYDDGSWFSINDNKNMIWMIKEWANNNL